MKKKPKQKLSPIQKRRFVKFAVIAGLAALLWVFFLPESGILALIRQQSALHSRQQEVVKLERENGILQKEIKKLKDDPVYLEKIARKKYGLLKQNEQVYDFSRGNKHKK